MKKFLALSLALLMALSLAACGSKTEQPAASDNSGDASTAESTGFIPSKNVTWSCTSSAGGGSDIFSRQIADIMKNEDLVNGQTIVISNETDGSGEVGRNKVATMKAGDADYTLLTFNSGDLMPMVQNTKNRSSNFRILAIMAVDKQLMFSCPASDAKTDYAKAGGDQNDFAAAIEAAKNGTFVVIGGSKGDDITTYQKLLAEVGLTEQQMGYITYDSTSDAITAALGGNVDFVISKPTAGRPTGTLVPSVNLPFSEQRAVFRIRQKASIFFVETSTCKPHSKKLYCLCQRRFEAKIFRFSFLLCFVHVHGQENLPFGQGRGSIRQALNPSRPRPVYPGVLWTGSCTIEAR